MSEDKKLPLPKEGERFLSEEGTNFLLGVLEKSLAKELRAAKNLLVAALVVITGSSASWVAFAYTLQKEGVMEAKADAVEEVAHSKEKTDLQISAVATAAKESDERTDLQISALVAAVKDLADVVESERARLSELEVRTHRTDASVKTHLLDKEVSSKNSVNCEDAAPSGS